MRFETFISFVIGIFIFGSGFMLAYPNKGQIHILDMYNNNYEKCISELPRNADCYLKGMEFTIKTKELK